jgi:hypothetical protein
MPLSQIAYEVGANEMLGSLSVVVQGRTITRSVCSLMVMVSVQGAGTLGSRRLKRAERGSSSV